MNDLRRSSYHRSHGPGRLLAVLLALAVVLGLSAGTAAAGPDEGKKPPRPAVAVPYQAKDVNAAMQPGWNLGNTLDAIPDETSWGNPLTTRAHFAKIRSEGFRSVRIPVTWTDHQSATAPYAVDATWMKRVQQVVDFAVAEGLYVVLNVHHDSWQWIKKMSTEHDQVVARYNSLWTQIARQFRDAPRSVLFESINEPQFADASQEQITRFLHELNTSFHSIVRASGSRNGNRVLVLPSWNTSANQKPLDDLVTTIRALKDPHLIATVHYYSWYPFSVNIAGGTRYDETAQKDLETSFDRVRDTLLARGIPVYLGEFGLLSWPNHFHPESVERGEALKYFEHLGHKMRTLGITTALWDAFNLLNRETLKWRDPALFALIKSSWTTRSGSTSFDRVYLPKSGAVPARSLTLNRNGLKFRGLWHGSGKLVQGRDYTLSGDRLTLTAELLTRLAGDRGYGVNATVQARFSAGRPWTVEVVTTGRPVLTNTTGTTEAFAVPAQYRGDQLATMHATYADGSNAGPTDWTPYQEFNQAFSPDYPKSTIVLTPAFNTSLREGQTATLVFHFYSGATVTYQVTRTDSTVTGTVA
ncbi:cellulase family glycosylhydrolase [Streptomyces sp. NPDC088745]|uniref:cellulase family glycosylhydrolase n=1 Tax=Streptomyces sp. NPDC088745 TaxID=3365884 RepID=UPI00382F5E3A